MLDKQGSMLPCYSLSTQKEHYPISVYGCAWFVCARVLTLVDLRGKLHSDNYEALMQSAIYKVIVVVMVVMSPLTAWLLFSQKLGIDQMQDA